MSVTTRVALAVVVLLLSPASMGAQWLSHPIPGTPRLPDGTPDLNAPAPRMADDRPDLSGIWSAVDNDYFFDITLELQEGSKVVMTPWAQGISEQRERRDHVDDPYGYCLPPGTPRILVARGPFKIIPTPAVTVMLFETIAFQTFRQVFTDGRPDADQPTADVVGLFSRKVGGRYLRGGIERLQRWRMVGYAERASAQRRVARHRAVYTTRVRAPGSDGND